MFILSFAHRSRFCAVNVIAYYSTTIFVEAGFSRSEALLTTMGTGICNFVFAIPAIFTIDTFGRRNLLLVTYPLMGLCLLWGGFSFLIPAQNGQVITNRSVAALEVRQGIRDELPEPTTAGLASIAAALYMFMVVYSPGEGPVPFTYSAEAFPLYIRDVGMSFATATCWGFNFIISLTWPALSRAFTPTGGMAWYAAWNFGGWFYVYFLLPESKLDLTVDVIIPELVLTTPQPRTSRWRSWMPSLTSETASMRSTTGTKLPGMSRRGLSRSRRRTLLFWRPSIQIVRHRATTRRRALYKRGLDGGIGCTFLDNWDML